MTYVFPPSLYPLRDYMRGLGADTMAFVTDRQAAFMAQQLLGTRVKFPSKGADMTSTLFLIQKGVTQAGLKTPPNEARNRTIRAPAEPARKGRQKGKAKDAKPSRPRKDFTPAVFASGVHIFCDGAAVPNPGVGGWGVVVYRDGAEIDSACGGDAETTNNRMEMTGLLKAIEMARGYSGPEQAATTIWCDSMYCVKGANEWRHKWKKNGWKRSAGATDLVKNVELWKAIDSAISGAPGLIVKWVKGHADIAGNERADELAEEGRQSVTDVPAVSEDLDAQYRAIMAGSH